MKENGASDDEGQDIDDVEDEPWSNQWPPPFSGAHQQTHVAGQKAKGVQCAQNGRDEVLKIKNK